MRFRAAVLLCLLACGPAPANATGPAEGTVGVNKFDLLLQYLGRASGGDGSSRYRKVTEAMARKAIADAGSAGIRYFRISATGYAPSGFGMPGDLELWRTDRAAFWSTADRMMDDLAGKGVQVIPSFVWNLRQFPSMNRETVRDLIVNPASRSYRMLEEYVAEFVTRYRSHPALLFYEIGNELNLHADLDALARCTAKYGRQPCEAEGNFSTGEMIAFTTRLAARIRSLDSARPISSGHSFPRPSAQHLRRQPEYAPGGPDWTRDRPDELAAYLEATHAGLEVMSVHIYEGEPMPGFAGSDHVELIALASRLARQLGKTLFIGEIGARSDQGLAPRSYLERALASIESHRVPYAALWIWQFYQANTYTSFDQQGTLFNIEPGRSDPLIRRIAAMNGAAIAGPGERPDRTPPVVVITWPLECARTDAALEVHLAASDDSGVLPALELQVGRRRLPVGGGPPYKAELGGLPPGEQDITVVATDRAGNQAAWTTRIVRKVSAGTGLRCERCCD